MDKRLKGITALPKAIREKLTNQQILCVVRYKSADKLKAVFAWRKRCAAASISMQSVAEKVKTGADKKDRLKPQRFSEYINLKHEPGDDVFNQIEMIILRFENMMKD